MAATKAAASGSKVRYVEMNYAANGSAARLAQQARTPVYETHASGGRATVAAAPPGMKFVGFDTRSMTFPTLSRTFDGLNSGD